MMMIRKGSKFHYSWLGLVTVHAIESRHTIVVVDTRGRYFRVSGLSL